MARKGTSTFAISPENAWIFGTDDDLGAAPNRTTQVCLSILSLLSEYAEALDLCPWRWRNGSQNIPKPDDLEEEWRSKYKKLEEELLQIAPRAYLRLHLTGSILDDAKGRQHQWFVKSVA